MAKVDSTQKYVAREKDGPIRAKVVHLFEDCSKLRNTPGVVMHPVSDETIELLGLRGCTACEKRQTGGPAIEALEEWFARPAEELRDSSAREIAWNLLEHLNSHHLYIAHRQPKTVTEVIEEVGVKP